MRQQPEYHDYIVPGLDVLIGDPDILSPLPGSKKRAEIFYIPEGYVRRVIDFYDEPSGRGDACKELTRRFGEILSAMNGSSGNSYQLANGTLVSFETTPKSVRSSKDQAVYVAKAISEKLGTNKKYVAIMTGSDQLSALAALGKIDVAHLNPDVYTGRRKIYLPSEKAGLWYGSHHITREAWSVVFPEEEPLRPNEFIEFIFDDFGQVNHSFKNIGRFDATENALVPLKYFKFGDPEYNRIYPRTAGQAMLLEALLAPPEEIPIVVVSGTYGTGKTFLSVAAGLFGVTKSFDYERVFICPRDGALGKDIGAVPGDATEKTLVKAKPIEDNIRALFRLTNIGKKSKFADDKSSAAEKRNCVDRAVEDAMERYFEYEPIIFMGGRSIANSFIIYDEFQDMERYQARALLTRIGDNSKIVVSGDPAQLSNPHLNRTSNGLSFSASKLAGKPEAAIITLTKDEIVRSPAALAIANYLA